MNLTNELVIVMNWMSKNADRRHQRFVCPNSNSFCGDDVVEDYNKQQKDHYFVYVYDSFYFIQFTF